ncbi:MAG: hypothetical protein WCD51_08620 [Anaerolineae bacterium]
MAQEFSYGGQAVIEGVMMRGSRLLAVAVRAPDGNIVLHTRPTLNAIFRRITDRKKSHLFRNPEGFATVFITTIRGALADHVVDRIEFLLPGDRLPTDLDQLFPSSQDFPQRVLVHLQARRTPGRLCQRSHHSGIVVGGLCAVRPLGTYRGTHHVHWGRWFGCGHQRLRVRFARPRRPP